jgi:uncharacterized membrane protein
MLACKDNNVALSNQTEAILEVLKKIPDWATRAEIARALGKRRLNPYELAALDLLVERGQIITQQEKMPGAIGFQWQYKVKENV